MSITGWQLENYKQMETKQHTPEQPLVKKMGGAGTKNILRQMKMEIQNTKTWKMQQKQF